MRGLIKKYLLKQNRRSRKVNTRSGLSQKSRKSWFFAYLVVFLTGCNTTHDPAAVSVSDLVAVPVQASVIVDGPIADVVQDSAVTADDSTEEPTQTLQMHHVQSGDTLYSIAWIYRKDVETLATVNHLRAPFMIYPGQMLTITDSGEGEPGGEKENKSHSKLVKKGTNDVVVGQSERSLIPEPKSAGISKDKAPNGAVDWHWPLQGKVVKVFSFQGEFNKGIDIRVKLGEPVRASADGEVVYAGSGLGMYGRLILIKHNSSYLSAYAHNKVLFVREGDSVKAGQKIAEIGSTGIKELTLHFEIRRNGKPVDPLRYLPTRGT
ncbi:Murein hydrolase activator NlpD [invertebrate metagenome]|uniref:Murein hydrolase activator NlpD n=1 Tax=invertebrate metagenome TaxID=1711999 RepID=A0A2H9T955_9ZZZZ